MFGSLVSRFANAFRAGDGGKQSTMGLSEESEELLLITVKSAAQKLAGSDRWAVEDNLALRVEQAGVGKLDGGGVDLESGDLEIFYYGPSRIAMLRAMEDELREIKAILDGMGVEIIASASRGGHNLLEPSA